MLLFLTYSVLYRILHKRRGENNQNVQALQEKLSRRAPYSDLRQGADLFGAGGRFDKRSRNPKTWPRLPLSHADVLAGAAVHLEGERFGDLQDVGIELFANDHGIAALAAHLENQDADQGRGLHDFGLGAAVHAGERDAAGPVGRSGVAVEAGYGVGRCGAWGAHHELDRDESTAGWDREEKGLKTIRLTGYHPVHDNLDVIRICIHRIKFISRSMEQ